MLTGVAGGRLSTMSRQECAICLGDPRDPRQILCGNNHVFCLSCLQGLVVHSANGTCFPCPCCRNRIQIPPGGAASFPPARIGLTRVDARRGTLGPRLRASSLDMEEVRPVTAQTEEEWGEEEEMLMYRFQINEAERYFEHGRRGQSTFFTGRSVSPPAGSGCPPSVSFHGLQAPPRQPTLRAATPHPRDFTRRPAMSTPSSRNVLRGAEVASSSADLDMEEVRLLIAEMEERQREEEEMLMYQLQINEEERRLDLDRGGRPEPEPLYALYSSLPFTFNGLQTSLRQRTLPAMSLVPDAGCTGPSATPTASSACFARAERARSSDDLDMEEVMRVIAQTEERQREEEEMLKYHFQLNEEERP